MMKVYLDITNSQTVDDEVQQIKSSVHGTFEAKEDGFVLSHPEKKLGGDTFITLSGDEVSVCRTGTGYSFEMVIKTGERLPMVYHTPFGDIPLETQGRRIASLVEENGGYIEFEYGLFSGGEKTSENRMKIIFSEEQDV